MGTSIRPSRPLMPVQAWRRREFRFPTTDVVVNGGALHGRLLNVARSGIAIESFESVRVGGEYRLNIEFENAGYAATGTVRWCVLRATRVNGRGEHVPVYHAGLSLEEQHEGDQEAVLDKLRKKLLQPPSY